MVLSESISLPLQIFPMTAALKVETALQKHVKFLRTLAVQARKKISCRRTHRTHGAVVHGLTVARWPTQRATLTRALPSAEAVRLRRKRKLSRPQWWRRRKPHGDDR